MREEGVDRQGNARGGGERGERDAAAGRQRQNAALAVWRHWRVQLWILPEDLTHGNWDAVRLTFELG